jgi:methionyl aminopeptidase
MDSGSHAPRWAPETRPAAIAAAKDNSHCAKICGIGRRALRGRGDLIRMTNKPGRNDPCWCGSNKKYKKCHLRPDEQAPETAGGMQDGTARLHKPARNHLVLTPQEQDAMRVAGAFNAELMDFIRPHVVVGANAEALDTMVHDYTVQAGHVPACLGYRGFPKSCCISVNEVVCHGIPNERVLSDGDIVNIDLTSIVDGWHGDQSETFLIGDVAASTRDLVQTTFDCMHEGIESIAPGSRVIEIGRAISKHAHSRGYTVVRDYQGHGIGRIFHQEPGVPHFPDHESGSFVLEPGMCFTIEPMINVGGYRTVLDKNDGWTVRTSDGQLSAQFEHTLLMTESGIEILTRTQQGPQRGAQF